MTVLFYKSILDKISVAASAACAIHCVALPVFFTSLPVLGIEILENIYVEFLTLGISMFIGGIAIFNGYKKYHQNKSILLLFVTGILSMAISNLVDNETIEITGKTVGAILLIAAHIKNWRTSKACTICEN